MAGRTPEINTKLNIVDPILKDRDPIYREAKAALTKLMSRSHQHNTASDRWNEMFDTKQYYAKVLFENSGNSFIYDFYDSRMFFARTIDRLKSPKFDRYITPPGWYETFIQQDVFTPKVNGVSLNDIAMMPYPLSEDNIDQIAKMNWAGAVMQWGKARGQAKQVLLGFGLLAAQGAMDLWEHDSVIAPQALRPLVARAMDYFDNQLTNFLKIPDEREVGFMDAVKRGHAHLSDFSVMEYYAPARLAITTASSVKFFQERAVASNLPKFVWMILRKKHQLEQVANLVVKPGAMPTKLAAYQLYDAAIDQQATSFLAGCLNQTKDTSSIEQFDQQLDKLAKYDRFLRGDIKHAPDRMVTLPISDHPVLDSVNWTYQNRRALVAVLKFKDNQTHLTVDINNHHLYGLPLPLLQAVPHAEFRLTEMLTQPLFNHLEQVHPELKQRSRIELIPGNVVPIRQSLKLSHAKSEEHPAQKLKTRGVVKEVSDQETPQVIQFPERKFHVEVTREMIEEALGRNSPPEVADMIVRKLNLFEHGGGKYKALKGAEDILELKADQHRIYLEKIGGNNLRFVELGNRRETFNVRRRIWN